jgi:hypothetical protein
MKIVSIIVFLFCQNLFSQVDFKCVIESKAIYPNDKFKVSFVSNDYIDEFVPPNFEKLGFKVIGGQGRSQSNVFENGKKTIVSEVFYFLTASKKGIYTIEKSKMESNGAIYFSKPISVAILDDTKTDDTFNDFFLFAEQEKENYLVNEPIALVYKLFYNNRIKIKDFGYVNELDYNGFNFNDSQIQFVAVEEEFKGKMYNCVTVKKDLIYPNIAGKFKFDSLGISINIKKIEKQIKGKKPVFSIIKKTAFSNTTEVTVKELPSANKPDDYVNAFGKFQIKLIAPSKELKANVPFEVKIEISGEGNFGDLEFPELHLIESIVESDYDLQIMNSKIDSDYKEYSELGIEGKKIRTYTLLSKKPNKETIPAIQFSYFEPELNKYQTIYTEQLELDVK